MTVATATAAILLYCSQPFLNFDFIGGVIFSYFSYICLREYTHTHTHIRAQSIRSKTKSILRITKVDIVLQLQNPSKKFVFQ